MPADIIGTRIYDAATATFRVERGPVFTNILLADEINRATPKTQSALLEAMQERQVTLADNTFPLDGSVLGPRHPEPRGAGRRLRAPRGAARSLFHDAARGLSRAAAEEAEMLHARSAGHRVSRA